MRFEKLNENKIRITLNRKDFEEKHINFHDFMANPIGSQDLFLDMLSEAEKQIGFITRNYQIRIEALAVSSGDFILTVTRVCPENIAKSPLIKKVKFKRKKTNINSSNSIYSFSTYDDFYYFMKFIKNQSIDIKKIAKSINLYELNNTYYLSFLNINNDLNITKKVFSIISEFASFVNNSDLFISRLVESGKIIIKNSAISSYLSAID